MSKEPLISKTEITQFHGRRKQVIHKIVGSLGLPKLVCACLALGEGIVIGCYFLLTLGLRSSFGLFHA